MLPALARHFHLTPVDVWDLSPEELQVYLEDLERMAAEAKKSAAQAKRTRRPRRR